LQARRAAHRRGLASGEVLGQDWAHAGPPTVLVGEPITNVAPGAGGIERDPATIHSHTFPGAADAGLLQNTVSMAVAARLEAESVVVEVTITNDLTGHHVPTDSPLRQLILLVEATDESGQRLNLVDGPVLPAWCGTGDPSDGHYAGLPGTAYARILQELWTEIAPTGAYWNPTRQLSDTRLAAFESDTTTYRFSAPPTSGTVSIDAQLLFRRAFIQIMEWKGWEVPHIEMEHQTITVP